jgi:predicted small integral membrane protein
MSHLSPPHLTSKLPGASSFLRVRCIISEWIQTRKSSTACILEASAGVCCLFGGPVFERSF